MHEIEITRMLDQLRRAFDGEAWSGPSLMDTLADIKAEQAAARPIPQAHSIWEIVLHVTAWVRTVERRIAQNEKIDLPASENWPPVPSPADDAAWQQTLEHLQEAHRELTGTVAGLYDNDLNRQLASDWDRPQGPSYYVLIHGVVQHNLYHVGQISLLKKAFT
ncbi:DinB family protein [Hymenobacter sp. BT491]|uniref:DinB family protein n=1 Tax=Hymenobacter sp. BT491 TaxID=2766779 RepID=UPI001653C862|nr:DinB family protein [Hymenobacter sp. BT491]MBC6990834.1 DinB family protein [Hymenobacter sp. BT491]